MYIYDDFDKDFVFERVRQFRNQVQRRIDGSLSEEEFKPLRLMNGLYLQLYAYMLRVAIPYGTISSVQMRCLADIADRWDRGYGHFTTRQNIQYNWPKLEDAPDILEALAEVEMHAIQTSGNCIRNVTADHFAGVAKDEIEDPRPIAEMIRQWSSSHPEFIFLPRKFKIAVTGATHDRAVVLAHDIGIKIIRNSAGELGYEVIVGGGLGRTPMIGKVIKDFIPKQDLLMYLEALMRVYNMYGRRDNMYKARIKILVHEEGIESIKQQVEDEYFNILDKNNGTIQRDMYKKELDRITRYFTSPAYDDLADMDLVGVSKCDEYGIWLKNNVFPHKQLGYCIVTVSLKPVGCAPGDATSDQMRAMADIAEKVSFSELRVSHEQNIILPYVRQDMLPYVYGELAKYNLATGNVNKISDIICCPGMDYCALATARSIPIAQEISKRYASAYMQDEIGELKIKISGCINACGHHHVGHIGILGLEKSGEENYQITLGGDASENAEIGKLVGPGFSKDQVVDAVSRLVDFYMKERSSPEETFLQTYRRVGHQSFKDYLYAEAL